MALNRPGEKCDEVQREIDWSNVYPRRGRNSPGVTGIRLCQVKTPLAQLDKLGALPDVPVRLVPDDLEDITMQASILGFLEKNLIITRRGIPAAWSIARLLHGSCGRGALIVDYAEKDRNGTRAALADNKQACKCYAALGSSDPSDRWDPLPGRPRASLNPTTRQANADRVSSATVGPELEADGIDHDRTSNERRLAEVLDVLVSIQDASC